MSKELLDIDLFRTHKYRIFEFSNYKTFVNNIYVYQNKN